jgi:branched-chain amino acid transport system ATP-binding protein
VTAAAASDLDAERAASAALHVDRLACGYDRTTILRDVTLTVPPSQITALLGPNGAGKTTLLRAISGFLPATSGSIHLFGEDVTKVSPYRRAERGLCHVPEGRGIFRSLTVRENLIMQAEKGRELEAIDRAASAFPIFGQRIRQLAGTLSGGQQQMLALASAYVRSPRLMLVDEASLGLAPLIVHDIFDSIKRIASEGAALLMVDQFVTRALEMSTTAYVMRRGQIVYHGRSAELLDTELFSRYLGTEV